MKGEDILDNGKEQPMERQVTVLGHSSWILSSGVTYDHSTKSFHIRSSFN